MRFGLLGPVSAADEDGPLDVRGAMPRAVLALLLLDANTVVSADRLMDALWGSSGLPASASGSLYNHVSRLRRDLRDAGRRRIRAAAPGYQITVEPGELDLDVFEDLCAQGHRAVREADWARAADRFASALALWRGEPLADVPASAGREARVQHVQETRLLAAQYRFDAELRLGRHHEAIGELQAVTAEQPLREVFHGQLMLALYRAGRQAQALEVFRSLRRTLMTELAVEPLTAIRDLHDRILRADPALDVFDTPSAPSAPAAGSGGEVRVRDGAAAAAATPAQLPADIGDFTGRTAQVQQLCALLAGASDDGSPRPVVVSAVTGAGGIGKTSLAVHVGHRLAVRFPDGQLYTDLRGTCVVPRDPVDVLGDWLRDLGVDAGQIPEGLEARSARFRTLSSGRRMLLVVDDARDAAQVRALLPGGGGCGVVATSRNRLPGLAGAVPLNLDVLTGDEALALFTAVVGAPRVQGEPEAVRAVLEICAGLPLAIRIAAARLAGRPGWSVADLAGRLADEHRRLDELRVEDLAVRACFQVSYAHLAEQPDAGASCGPARAFRMLGLWIGPDTSLEAAAELLGEPPERTERWLEALVDANLLESPAAGRYRLHDLLRVYARELAEAEEPEAERAEAVNRLINWYLHTVSAAADRFSPYAMKHGLDTVPPCERALTFPDRQSAAQWCQRHRPHFAAAIALACGQPGNPAAWILPTQLMQFYSQYSHWHDFLESHTAGLRVARELGDALAQSRLHIGLGIAYYKLGRLPEALEANREALALAEAGGNPPWANTALANYASTLYAVERYDEAIAAFEKSMADDALADKPGLLAARLNNLGMVYHTLKRYSEAADRYRQALELARAAGLPFVEAAVLDGIGQTRHALGEHGQAVAAFERAIDLRTQLGDQEGLAATLDRLGDVLAADGRQEQARAAWRKALAAVSGLEDPVAQAVRAKLEGLDPDRHLT